MVSFGSLSIYSNGGGSGSGSASFSAASTDSIGMSYAGGTLIAQLNISGITGLPANTQGISHLIYSGASPGLIGYFPSGALSEVTSSILQFSGPGTIVGFSLGIRVNQATGSTPGYLSAADFTTFNAKQAAIGYTAVPQARIVGTTFPLLGGGDLSADRVLSMPIANGSTGGYLSATDWTTFNNKASTFTSSEIVRGTADSKGGSSSGDTCVVNYSAAITSVGSDITFTGRTATTGDLYTINTTGRYAIWATMRDNAGGDVIGLTVNATSGSTAPQSLAAAQVPVIVFSVANGTNYLAATVPLTAGDIVRLQTESGVTVTSTTSSRFGITRVS